MSERRALLERLLAWALVDEGFHCFAPCMMASVALDAHRHALGIVLRHLVAGAALSPARSADHTPMTHLEVTNMPIVAAQL
jgi:hypothetical protein